MPANNNRTLYALAILGITFYLMYVLNAWMPMYRDDYIAAVIWGTGDHLSSMQDVFLSLKQYYLTHGGRLVSFFIQFAFLLYGKFWFNLGNALVFVLMVVFMYLHASRSLKWSAEPSLLLALVLFFWLGVSHFGEIAIWLCGSAVYLWTGLFTAVFLLPYNLEIARRKEFTARWLAPAMLILGMIAACSVENLTVTTTLLAFAITGWCWKKQQRLRLWMVTGAIGSLIGTIACLAAPGNFVRYVADQDRSIFFHFANQISANMEMLLYMLPIFLIMVLAWRILIIAAARKRGLTIPITPVKNHHYTLLVLVIIFAVSYFKGDVEGGPAAIWLRDAIVAIVLTPLGLTDQTTISHFANTMSGFEEVMVYWLSVAYVYLTTINRANLFKKTIRPLKKQITRRIVWQEYPELHYAAFLFVLAFFNNLVVVGAPSFPGRALFGSSIILLISAAVVLRIPEVKDVLLVHPAGKVFRTGGIAIVSFIVAATLIIMHAIWLEDAARVAMIAAAAQRGELVVTVPPSRIPETMRALRHIAYDDFNTGMTREECCAYFGINDIRLDPGMKLEK